MHYFATAGLECIEAEKPKGQGVVKNKVVKILSPEELNKLIDATEDRKYQVLFRLAIMSGARQGEILGLKWSDIDWNNSQIHIQRTYNNQACPIPKPKHLTVISV